MCSYNEYNGVPACGDAWLLRDVLRDGWGFDGYVTSDSGAVEWIYEPDAHNYTATPEEGVALALRAGTDVDSNLDRGDHATGSPYVWYFNASRDAGLIAEADVDAALNRTLWLRFALGLFDPIDDQPLWRVPPEVVGAPEHARLSLDMAREGIVLLKNDASTLPLAPGQTIAVLGPHANATKALAGNYLGQLCADAYGSFDCVPTPHAAIARANAGGATTLAEGVSVSGDDGSGIDAALALARDADAVVLMLGLDTETVEREGLDRVNISLPGRQDELARRALALGKPTVAVLLNGGAVGCDALAAAAPALVEAFYPSAHGAEALADVLFGAVAPSGRMPYTTPRAAFVDEVDFLDYNMSSDGGKTYKYVDPAAPLFPFGWGLSYTNFSLALDGASAAPRALATADARAELALNVSVRNVGPVAGAEVLLLYVAPRAVAPRTAGTPVVRKQLVDFARLDVLAPGEAAVARFSVPLAAFALADANGDLLLLPGEYALVVDDGAYEQVAVAVTLSGDITVVEPFIQPSS